MKNLKETPMENLIMEFRISHTRAAVELSLDEGEGGTGMYVISSVRNYGEMMPAVRVEECRIADRDDALLVFDRHCKRLVGDWKVG